MLRFSSLFFSIEIDPPSGSHDGKFRRWHNIDSFFSFRILTLCISASSSLFFSELLLSSSSTSRQRRFVRSPSPYSFAPSLSRFLSLFFLSFSLDLFLLSALLFVSVGGGIGLLLGIITGFAPIARQLKINERYIRQGMTGASTARLPKYVACSTPRHVQKILDLIDSLPTSTTTTLRGVASLSSLHPFLCRAL